MRFSVAVAGVFAVAVSAQSTTVPDSPSTTASVDPVQSSLIACVNRCEPGDVQCLSYCNPVPSVDEEHVVDTTECMADCDQGDGSPEDTAAYAECQQSCIRQHYYASTGTPRPTGAPASGNGNEDGDSNDSEGNDAAETTGTDSEGPSETTTGSPDSTEASNAAETPNGEDPENGASTLAGSTAAIFGLFAAMLAL